MKSLFIFAAALFFTIAAQSEILSSHYDERHQALLESAILESCGVSGQITQKSSDETSEVVDNGQRDIYYTTKFELTVRVDQNLYDTYYITAKSAKYDYFDHESGEMGKYVIESILCSH
jgi:hypothetical protein